MPKNAIDYSKTIIYRIVCKDVNVTECYVGQTTNFTKRKQKHKHSCNNENCKNYNCYVYQFIRNNMGWNNWDMIEVEKYEATDSNDLHKRERYWVEFYKASLNKRIPSRTKKEYYKLNQQEILEQRKDYYENNKELILEKNFQYRKDNKELINEKKKLYCEDNKQKIAERDKKYYEKNKYKITCECGCIITKYNLSIHKKSKKHLDNNTRLN